MSGREIIAREFRVQHQNVCYPNASDGECQIVADSILSALTAAGYRIIGPGELDRETLERAAEVAGTHIAEPGLSDNSAYIRFNPADLMAKKIVAAIRALAGKAGEA